MSEDRQISGIPQEAEPSSFRLIATLGIAGLISGILLVGAYLYTLPMIEANRAEALKMAIYKVLPECTSFLTLELIDDRLQEVKEEQNANKDRKNKVVPKIFAGFNDSGKLIGFAMPAEEPGFQDIIGAIIGYDAESKMIIGFEVLESKETPGLGDKILNDKAFKLNFVKLATEPQIIPVKNGQKNNPNEVETITGATISSKAVVRLLNKGMEAWKQPITKYLEANKLRAVNPEND